MIPVSSSSCCVDCSTNSGAGLWIGSKLTFFGAGLLSMGSPKTLKIRPNVFSPTGTLIGAPVAIASIPLTNPSVEPMAIHLTVSSPRCCATSTVSWLPSFNGILIASLISGSLPSVNFISRTALIICVILPEQSFSPVFTSAISPPI